MSLRARVTLAATVSVGLVLAVVGITLVALVARDQRQAVDERLRQQARAFDRPAVVRALLRTGRTDTGDALGSGGNVQLVDGDGQVLVEAGQLPDGALPPPGRPGLSSVEIGEQTWRVLTVDVVVAGPGVTGQVTASLEEQEAALASLRRRVAGLSALALTGAAAGGWVLGGRALRPLGRLRATAAEVAADADASRRVPDANGAAEVDGLAATLNRMLARLQGAVSGERAAAVTAREFAANAAHELRTPMAALSANIDVLRRPDLTSDLSAEVLDDVRADVRRLASVLGALEQLARADLQLGEAARAVDVGEVVDAAVADARRRHPDATFSLRISAADDAPPPTIAGWAEGLRIVCDNLLDNAARHGRLSRREAATIDVGLSEEDEQVVLRVADGGPGIPAGERAAVLDRFGRGTDAVAPGSGLGLALVEQQVRLHRGTLHIDDAPGGGCRVTVRLPKVHLPTP